MWQGFTWEAKQMKFGIGEKLENLVGDLMGIMK